MSSMTKYLTKKGQFWVQAVFKNVLSMLGIFVWSLEQLQCDVAQPMDALIWVSRQL